jgi:hypothetical protein
VIERCLGAAGLATESELVMSVPSASTLALKFRRYAAVASLVVVLGPNS